MSDGPVNPPASARDLDGPVFVARVLRAFVRDGRLVSIPARERKKQVIYRFLLDQAFPDPGEVLHERDVNMRLALWHPDVATIRRGLVDFGLLRREGMAYQRAVPAGGPADGPALRPADPAEGS